MAKPEMEFKPWYAEVVGGIFESGERLPHPLEVRRAHRAGFSPEEYVFSLRQRRMQMRIRRPSSRRSFGFRVAGRSVSIPRRTVRGIGRALGLSRRRPSFRRRGASFRRSGGFRRRSRY